MRRAFLLVASLALVSCAQEVRKEPLATLGLFVVPGNKPHLETGFDLQPGRYYLFRHVDGMVCTQREQRCAPPRGSDVPGQEAWGLRLPIGNDLLQVRDGLVVRVEQPTPLTFFVPEGEELPHAPDKLPLYQDNTGSWTIEVSSFQEAPELEWYQGVNVTSYSEGGYCSPEMPALLRRLLALGANAVQFVVVFQTDSQAVFPVGHSPREFCIARATRQAQQLGLKVGWNLHVDPPDNGWRGELEPPDRPAFFESYREFAVYHAKLAQQHAVDFLLPATEMVSLTRTPEDRARWVSIFLELHGHFFGTIYYGADRSEFEQLDLDFWHSCCDAVGMTPWYGLSNREAPSAAELEESWKEHVAALEEYAETAKMRIFLAEGPGYMDIPGCASSPAEYVSPSEQQSELCQAEAYKAFLKTFSRQRKQLFAGHFIWEVSVPGEKKSRYDPLDKVAESVLKQGWRSDQL